MNKRNISQPMLLSSLIKDPTHWGILMEYVAVEKDHLVNQLLKCTEGQLKSIQGELKALEKLSALSITLKSEEASKRRST